jgi:transposase
MESVLERCCGLDVHKKTVVACVLVRKGAGWEREIRTFSTMTMELLVLHDWLKAYGVTHVAMESTGVFWKPVFNLLEDSFHILLVNAAHMKAVPGRKTDVRDCEWIADLLAHGLLKGSFIPPEPIRDLRDLTRYRKSLTEERVREINRLQKIMETANIKLASVASNVLGVSGRKMLEALVEGSRDAEALADLARGSLRKKLPLLTQALDGKFRPHHQFLLKQIMAHLDFLEEMIEQISEEVGRRLNPFSEQTALLMTIPGVNRRVAETVIAELGVDMDRFASHRHLASWVGLCPGNNESAGKRRTGKTRKGDVWLKGILVESAWVNTRLKGYFGAQYHRIARRRGKKRALVSVAHSLLVTIYHVLKKGVPYRELGVDYFDQLNLESLKKRYVSRLQSIGFRVNLEPIQASTQA